ncbi:hypothetical protein TNCV_4551221 [Trichonephila clavipes]|nr:hypothetical protein TNCV_4551221 [Trichonephila clavipes]
MTNGRLSFLEHCIQSEKEFPDLTDDDALVGFQNEHDELSSLKEQDLGELALFLPCPVLDCPENEKNSKNEMTPGTKWPSSPDQRQNPRSPFSWLSLKRNLIPRYFKVKSAATLRCRSTLLTDDLGFHNVTTVICLTTRRKTALCAPDASNAANPTVPMIATSKKKIENPYASIFNKTGHMANWSQCEEFPKRKLKKGETIRNRNTPIVSNKPAKPVTPKLSFAAALSGASNKNSTPGTSAAPEETPSINENSNDKDFGFKDAICELRRFF